MIVLLLLLLLQFAPSQAAAQNVDLIVNMNDIGSDPTTAGGTANYNITVGNDGLDPSLATVLTLNIPAGTTFTGGTGTISGCAPTPAVGPTTVACTVPAMGPGAPPSTLVASLQTSVAGTVNFNVDVPTAGDADPSNNDASESTTITAGADIGVLITGPATAPSGSTAAFTVVATNNGPNTSGGFTVTVPVPTGMANVVAPAGCTLTGGAYTCLIAGPVAVGASVNLDFSGTFIAGSGSSLAITANVSGGTPADPISANDTDALSISITAGSDLSVGKTRSPGGLLVVGDPVTFTLSPAYTGDSPNGITVTDILPANYTVGTVTAPGWLCTVTGQTVSCTSTSGSGAGNNISLGNITISAVVASSGTPTNTATITAVNPNDPNPANNAGTDGGATIQDPTVDLSASKSGPVPALYVVGNSYDFTLGASNLGNSPFIGTLLLTDAVPAGLQSTSVGGPGWTCLPAGVVDGPATVTCTRVYTAAAPLLPGASAPPVTMSATATAEGAIANTVTVSSPDANIPDVNPGNDTTTYTGTGGDPSVSADISVTKSASPATVVAGDPVTFTLSIRNAGPVASTSVQLTDDLNNLMNNLVGPNGSGVVSVSTVANGATGLTCATAPTGGTSRRLTCDIASLPVCTSAATCPSVTVTVRAGGEAGSRTNTANVISSTVGDADLTDNVATAPYAVTARTDVTVTKTDSADPIPAGQNLVYVVTAQTIGNGLSSAANVTITDTLPAGMTFVSAVPSTGSCGTLPSTTSPTGPGNNLLICNFGTIANGAQQTVIITVRPNTSTRNTTLRNNVTISTTTPETDATNNAAFVDTTVSVPVLDILVNKTDSVDPVAIGDDTVYTIVVSNLGPSAAENVVFTDRMPATRLSYQSHTVPAGVTCSSVPTVGSFGGVLTCTIPNMPAGESQIFTVTALGTAKGVGVNRANATSDETTLGFEANTANNAVTERTTVRTRADVQVTSKTASPTTVNLREPFTYTILVRNNTGPSFNEADNTLVSDTLPSNMVLTGTPTISVTAGTASASACTGSAGAGSFTCDLGTFSSGGEATIVAPVMVTSIASQGQVFTNTATISTSSRDMVPANNSNSGPVTVNGSTIAGTLFRDFANDGAMTVGDSGISGIVMTLTGTTLDGTAISQTFTTGSTGNFTFGFLPEGTYSIAQGTVAEAFLTDGTTAEGTSGGTAAPTSITAISLGANTAATAYLFPKVPQARIALAKTVQSGPTINTDGSFLVTFRFSVANPSLEALTNINLTDVMSGAAPSFGTLASAGPGMAAGTYGIAAPPSGSCGGANAGFDGDADTVLATGFTVAAGGSCTLDVQVQLQPTAPLPALLSGGGRYLNQAEVTGEGQTSGQTSATNPQLQDLSDNGTTADPDGDGQGNETGENDPTPVTPVYTPEITLTKVIDLAGLPAPVAAGGVVTFSFTVENTGNVALTNVTLAESLAGATVSGGPIPVLLPGASDTTTFTATYTLTAADLTANSLSNTATATGTWGTDAAGNPQTVNDPDTLVTRFADIAVTKTADASALTTPTAVGDIITYNFTVENTGGIPLQNIRLTDPLPGITVTPGPIVSLAVGAQDSTTFTATYAVTQADIDAGQVINRATTFGAYGTDGAGNPLEVNDESGATMAEDADTVVPLTIAARISLIKSLVSVTDTSGDGFVGAGDAAVYAFAVTNTGNVALAGVAITDPLVTVSGGPISLAVGVVDATSFTASYTLTQADVDAGFVENTAEVTGNAVTGTGTPILDASGAPVTATDTSDSGTDPTGGPVTDPEDTETGDGTGTTDGDPANDPTVALLVPDPRITLVKALSGVADTNADGLTNAGDTASYGFTVTNSGNVALAGVTVSDPLVTMAGGPVDLAVGASDTASFTATYVITQADVDAGFFDNTASATGAAVTLGGAPILDAAGAPVTTTDVSDTGTAPDGSAVTGPGTTETPDGDGTVDADPGNDPTSLLLGPQPRLQLVKLLTGTVDVDGNGFINAGDRADYTFRVTNTGNLALAGVTLSDPLVTVAGGPVDLAIGASDSTSFTAQYTLVQADIDAGFVENTATATGAAVTAAGTPILDASGAPVTATDTSDSGTDPSGGPVTDPDGTETPDGTGTTDGDPANDPTVATLQPVARISLIKSLVSVTDTSGDGFVGAGDAAVYAFAVTNTGNVALAGVAITDPLVTVSGGPISLAVGVVDATSFTASYTLTQADVDAGFVENTAEVTGNAVTGTGTPILDASGAPVTATDTSDSGTDPTGGPVTDPEDTETGDGTGTTDGDPANDPTVALLVPTARIGLVKTAVSSDENGNGLAEVGETIVYTFAVTNTGNVTVTGVTIADPLPGLVLAGGPIASLAPGAVDATTITGVYTLTQADLNAGQVVNQATASGSDPTGNPVTDASDESDSTGGDPTVVPVLIGSQGGLEIAKTVNRSTAGVGDVLTYTITVRNLGAVGATTTNVQDLLPAGFVYQPGTALVNGTAVEPVVSGRRVTWVGVVVPASSSIAITLDVRLSGSVRPGTHDNVATAIDPVTGEVVAGPAIASVRVTAEPVFDCSTVIGRVFDDLNQDGYYNGEPAVDRSAITDQTYHGGKWGKWGGPEEPQRERGIPGVRLVAPNGQSVTTDEHGRFSVPCAALPADIGSNFMLKVDPRTLPSGYRMTTENPRVVRLTPGMLTKMNFGATISRVVQVDLYDRAFDQGDSSVQPRAELAEALKGMVAEIARTPTVLRLSYQLADGESENLARQRLRSVERVIRKLWPDEGRYQLNVETVVQK